MFFSTILFSAMVALPLVVVAAPFPSVSHLVNRWDGGNGYTGAGYALLVLSFLRITNVASFLLRLPEASPTAVARRAMVVCTSSSSSLTMVRDLFLFFASALTLVSESFVGGDAGNSDSGVSNGGAGGDRKTCVFPLFSSFSLALTTLYGLFDV